jgi:hypothetical protein
MSAISAVQRSERIDFIGDRDELHVTTDATVTGPDELEFAQGPDGWVVRLHELIRTHLTRLGGIVPTPSAGAGRQA